MLGGLKNLGFSSIEEVRVGKYLEVRVDEADRPTAESLVADMCQKVLSNPVIEEFHFELEEVKATQR